MPDGPGSGREALAARVAATLEGLLPRRDRAAPRPVLGAGSDDLTAGRRYLALLAEHGFAVPTWPVAHGGMGLAPAEADVVSDVLADFEAPDLYPFLVGLDLIGPAIIAHAGPEQQRRWLPRLRSGEDIWCQMFSEPDAGSDLANLATQARPDGETWRVTGSKVWTSRAHYAERGLLLARSDPTLPKHAGITAFGLDMATPGITVRPLTQMNGDRHFNQVFLDEVEIPDADRIGEVGEGWRVAITCLTLERGSLAGDLGVTIEQIRGLARRLPGGPPGARDRLARALADATVLAWAEERTRAARRAGGRPGPEGSLAKLRANRLLKGVADLAMGLEGAAGARRDEQDPWQQLFLVAPSLSIRGGTDEIQRTIVGERGLGLPPEPRVDKDRPLAAGSEPPGGTDASPA